MVGGVGGWGVREAEGQHDGRDLVSAQWMINYRAV